MTLKIRFTYSLVPSVHHSVLTIPFQMIHVCLKKRLKHHLFILFEIVFCLLHRAVLDSGHLISLHSSLWLIVQNACFSHERSSSNHSPCSLTELQWLTQWSTGSDLIWLTKFGVFGYLWIECKKLLDFSSTNYIAHNCKLGEIDLPSRLNGWRPLNGVWFIDLSSYRLTSEFQSDWFKFQN